MFAALALLLFMASGAEETPKAEVESVGASITFDGGICIFWTGDKGMDAKQFRTDLERFTLHEHLSIYFSSDVPKKCVNAARRAGRDAGFKVVSATLGNNRAGPVGPPIISN